MLEKRQNSQRKTTVKWGDFFLEGGGEERLTAVTSFLILICGMSSNEVK